jgi:hypothetical protein
MNKNMKIYTAAIISSLLSISAVMTVFAGSVVGNYGNKRYLNDDGSYAKNQWEQVDGQWCYFGSDTYMLYNYWIGNYYIDFSGYMATDKVTDIGERVGSDGAWIPENTDYEKDIFSKLGTYGVAKCNPVLDAGDYYLAVAYIWGSDAYPVAYKTKIRISKDCVVGPRPGTSGVDIPLAEYLTSENYLIDIPSPDLGTVTDENGYIVRFCIRPLADAEER